MMAAHHVRRPGIVLVDVPHLDALDPREAKLWATWRRANEGGGQAPPRGTLRDVDSSRGHFLNLFTEDDGDGAITACFGAHERRLLLGDLDDARLLVARRDPPIRWVPGERVERTNASEECCFPPPWARSTSRSLSQTSGVDHPSPPGNPSDAGKVGSRLVDARDASWDRRKGLQSAGHG